MKVNDARVCLDCDELFNSSACPACTSRQFIRLGLYLPPLLPELGRARVRDDQGELTDYGRRVLGLAS